MGNWKLDNTRNLNTGTIGILEHFQTRKLERKTEEQILHNLVTERGLQKKISVIGMATRIGNPITLQLGARVQIIYERCAKAKMRTTPYVMSMANQPPNETRTAALHIFAPPRRAPMAPKATSATEDANTMDTSL